MLDHCLNSFSSTFGILPYLLFFGILSSSICSHSLCTDCQIFPKAIHSFIFSKKTLKFSYSPVLEVKTILPRLSCHRIVSWKVIIGSQTLANLYINWPRMLSYSFFPPTCHLAQKASHLGAWREFKVNIS